MTTTRIIHNAYTPEEIEMLNRHFEVLFANNGQGASALFRKLSADTGRTQMAITTKYYEYRNNRLGRPARTYTPKPTKKYKKFTPSEQEVLVDNLMTEKYTLGQLSKMLGRSRKSIVCWYWRYKNEEEKGNFAVPDKVPTTQRPIEQPSITNYMVTTNPDKTITITIDGLELNIKKIK